MMYPNNPKQLKKIIDDLNRQIEILIRRLGIIASSDVIENKKLCEAYIEMISVRTAALKSCEKLMRSSILINQIEDNHRSA